MFKIRNGGRLLLGLLLWSGAALSGPLQPCIKAVASKNGRILVIIEGQNAAAPTHLSVFPKENWINQNHRITDPLAYWTDFLQWSIVLSREDCPLPLVTDDGEFVILLSRDALVDPNSEAFRIYRRRDHIGDPLREGPDHGVFIKALLFREIWSPERIKVHPQFATDHSPVWFVGSTFDFSEDNRELLYTSEGGTLHVRLSDGTVSKP